MMFDMRVEAQQMNDLQTNEKKKSNKRIINK